MLGASLFIGWFTTSPRVVRDLVEAMAFETHAASSSAAPSSSPPATKPKPRPKRR